MNLKMLIKTNNSCNNKCSPCKGDFCFFKISEKEKKDKNIYIITGKEPTKNKIPLKELIIKIIQKDEKSKIILHTNGRLLSDPSFTKGLIYAGLNNFRIWLTVDKNKYENITNIKNGLQEVLKGISNLKDYPVNINLFFPFLDKTNEKIIKDVNNNFNHKNIYIFNKKKTKENLISLLKKKIKTNFDIEVHSLSVLENNHNNNLLYLINNKYILKINKLIFLNKKRYGDYELNRITLLYWLNQKKMPFDVPIENKNKRSFFKINNRKFCLYDFYIGEKYNNYNQLKNVINVISKYHKIVKEKEKNNFPNFLEYLSLKLNQFEKFFPKPGRIEKILIKKVKKFLENSNQFEKCILHFDISPENMIFQKNSVLKIIDYTPIYGPKIKDLGDLINHFVINNKIKNKISTIKWLIEEYQKNNKLKKIEIKNIFNAIYASLLNVYIGLIQRNMNVKDLHKIINNVIKIEKESKINLF